VLTLETPRLLFVSTPVSVMRRRLTLSDFLAEVAVGPCETAGQDGRLTVHFPPEWPGEDAIQMFPIWIARRDRSPDPGPWCDGVVVRRLDRLAVGSMGFKSAPDAAGTVEIGYAVNRPLWGRGYATETVRAIVAWALGQPAVRTVTAECLESNPASARVLEKSGFEQVGRRRTVEGDLLLGECRTLVACGAPIAGASATDPGDQPAGRA
jgi:[ribosomal protein S5]-alanine N-acetyltransferase